MSDVVGLDGWKSQWVGVRLADGRFDTVEVVADVAALLARTPAASIVAIDIPIGFPVNEPRRCEVEAARMIGPRRSSVFVTPPREVLEAESYAEAREISKRTWGRGLTAQAFALRTKVLEISTLASDTRLIETHPEVSFHAMAGQHLGYSKKSWAGQLHRRRLLAEQGIELPDDLGDVGVVPPDDILDAAACAWTAHRHAAGRSQSLPKDPERGEPVIWY